MFDELGLGADVLRAVGDLGFTEPTPIQTEAIPPILEGRDVLGRAQTGTGKTAAYTLPLIDILSGVRARARMPRALILAPTRELAAQIAEHFEGFGRYHPLKLALLIGGVSIEDQDRKIDRGVDVLIATPGRLIDHFENGKLILHGVKVLVIDEADRMLDMGFIPDVERIVRLTPPLRQTLMFSATMPPEIRRLADALMTNPKEVSVAPPVMPAEMVDHVILEVRPRDKGAALRRLMEAEGIGEALIFCNRKKDVDALRSSLRRHGLENVAALHGDMSQPERTATLEAFRRGDVKLLVASDVAGRGLDITELPVVISFDVPVNREDYVHRIGRTGRAGRRGRAVTLATPEDAKQVAAIERLIGQPIPRIGPRIEVPTAEGASRPREEAKGRRRAKRPPKARAEAKDAEAEEAVKAKEASQRPPRPEEERRRSRSQEHRLGRQPARLPPPPARKN